MDNLKKARRKTRIEYVYPDLSPDPTRPRAAHRLRRALVDMPSRLAGALLLAGLALLAMLGAALFVYAITPVAASEVDRRAQPTAVATVTPLPTATTTPTLRPTAIIPAVGVEDGWFERDDDGGVVVTLYRAVDGMQSLQVFACWTGGSADGQLSNGSIEQHLAVDASGKPVPICVEAIARFEHRGGSSKLAGRISKGLRHALLNFDTEMWTLLHVQVFYANVPPGYVIKARGSG